MASPVTKVATVRVASTALSTAQVAIENASAERIEDHPIAANFLGSLPCVLYECNLALELTYLSPNAQNLLGVPPRGFLGTADIWQERLLPDDWMRLRDQMTELEESECGSALHRIVDDRGLPLWVCHTFRRVRGMQVGFIRGCIVPLRNEEKIYDLEQAAIGRFIHKLGNHFQLLNLVINSLKKNLGESRETAVLEQTVENAIDLTRTFSEYCQVPTWSPIFDFTEIINAAAMTRRQSFLEKQVVFHREIDECSLKDVVVRGDPYLLELALGSVLENALEATPAQGSVALHASAEIAEQHRAVVRLRVRDSGTGVEPENMDRIKLPFHTSKMNHNGLGLSMAVRFIEMHEGLLTIKNREGQGTEVNITLPAEAAIQFQDDSLSVSPENYRRGRR